MFKLSKKTDYAIILLTHLGEKSNPVSSQEVASFYKLPQPMVANILKVLVSSGLIKSIRGQKGGYVLGRSPDKINLSEIIRITDRDFELVECVHEEDSCRFYKCCPTRQPLIALHQKIKQFVEETTLRTIIQDTGQ
tara:strand:+ start:389 stop:796 length:408 start_codon:yes stop_codon:yes gene_type:complete